MLPYLALSELSLGSSILAQSNVIRRGQCSWLHTTLNQSCLWVISREIRASTHLQLKSKLLLTKNRALECCVGRRLHIKSHSWRLPYSLLPQHLTVSHICLLHTLTMVSPQLCKEVEYVRAFSSHSSLLNIPGHALHAVSRLYDPNHSSVVAQAEEEPCHALPQRGLLQTLLPPSPMKGTGKLTLKAVETDWENICNVADLFLGIRFIFCRSWQCGEEHKIFCGIWL